MKNSREENEFIRHYLHSKQGISFVTLTHKTVMKKMSQSFFVVASKIGDFANQFLDTVLQCCPTIFGRFSHPDAHYFCRFLEFGRGGDDFLRKKQNNFCCFQKVFNFPAAISHWLRGFFAFSDSFQFLFEISIFYLYIK